MGEKRQEQDFVVSLEQERPRLVRLCAWLSGDAQAAEDLAQETLLAAWKHQGQLRQSEKRSAWLSSIARNTCMSWARKQTRQIQRVEEAAAVGLEEGLPVADADASAPEEDLDRGELARLLEQALALLPARTARLLVAHYIEEVPQAEIAEKLGLKVGAVAVQIQRGKLTLRRLLRTRLQQEALALGLLPVEAPAWQETNIWCTHCGERRLVGQYLRDTADARFLLRCPNCHPDPTTIMVGHDLTRPYYDHILGGVKTIKPAYTRLIIGLSPFFRQALCGSAPACLVCGSPVIVQRSHERRPNEDHRIRANGGSEVFIHCSACDWATNTTLSGLVLALPEAQRFWRDHPRLRTLPPQVIETQGALAYVTRLQSLASAAELAVISRRDTLAVMAVHKSVYR